MIYVLYQLPNLTVNVLDWPITETYWDNTPVTPTILVVIIGFVGLVKKFTGLLPYGTVFEIGLYVKYT